MVNVLNTYCNQELFVIARQHDIDIAIVSLSVCLSICPSATFRYSMETA